MTVYENVQAKLKKPMTKIHYIYIIYPLAELNFK